VIRRAVVEEATEAVSILREVAQWLVDIGRPLWLVNSFDVTAFDVQPLRVNWCWGTRAPRLLRVCSCRGDDIYWPNDAPGDALYVHKVAGGEPPAGLVEALDRLGERTGTKVWCPSSQTRYGRPAGAGLTVRVLWFSCGRRRTSAFRPSDDCSPRTTPYAAGTMRSTAAASVLPRRRSSLLPKL